jgi:hypothetical protein
MRTLGHIGDGQFWFRLVRVGEADNYFTMVFSPLPGGNVETFLAVFFLSIPVGGFRPFSVALLVTPNAPKPIKATLWPFSRALEITSKTVLTAVSASFLAHTLLSTSLIKSLLFLRSLPFIV